MFIDDASTKNSKRHRRGMFGKCDMDQQAQQHMPTPTSAADGVGSFLYAMILR